VEVVAGFADDLVFRQRAFAQVVAGFAWMRKEMRAWRPSP
jgi:hypothetical protein